MSEAAERKAPGTLTKKCGFMRFVRFVRLSCEFSFGAPTVGKMEEVIGSVG